MVKDDLTPRIPNPHRGGIRKTCSAGSSNKPASRKRSGAGIKKARKQITQRRAG
jgi:hypothetical protein